MGHGVHPVLWEKRETSGVSRRDLTLGAPVPDREKIGTRVLECPDRVLIRSVYISLLVHGSPGHRSRHPEITIICPV